MMKFRNLTDYQKHIKDKGSMRSKTTEYIAKELHKESSGLRRFTQKLCGRSPTLHGFCKVCSEPVSFSVNLHTRNGGTHINFRESLHCPNCTLSNRQRFIFSYISNHLEDSKEDHLNIYIYEQVTAFYQKMQTEYGHHHSVIGSEYLGFDKSPGETIKGIRHEDALNLSFSDNSLDFLVSQDVLEHVPDHRKAILEAYRVLKKGGTFLFSIPFDTQKQETIQRAEMTAQGIRHHLPEQYHGNPVDPKGSLVFFDFGWDIFKDLLHTGFEDAYLLSYYDMLCGHIGGSDQFCFVAIK